MFMFTRSIIPIIFTLMPIFSAWAQVKVDVPDCSGAEHVVQDYNFDMFFGLGSIKYHMYRGCEISASRSGIFYYSGGGYCIDLEKKLCPKGTNISYPVCTQALVAFWEKLYMEKFPDKRPFPPLPATVPFEERPDGNTIHTSTDGYGGYYVYITNRLNPIAECHRPDYDSWLSSASNYSSDGERSVSVSVSVQTKVKVQIGR